MLVRGLDPGQSPVPAAGGMNPRNCQVACQRPAGQQLHAQGNLGFQVLELDTKTEFHLGSLFRGWRYARRTGSRNAFAQLPITHQSHRASVEQQQDGVTLAQPPAPRTRRPRGHHEPPAPSPVQPCLRSGRAAIAVRLNGTRWDIASRRRGIFQTSRSPHTRLSCCTPCPPLAKLSCRQSSPKTSTAPATGVAARLPCPAREQGQPAPKRTSSLAPWRCQEMWVSGCQQGRNSANATGAL